MNEATPEPGCCEVCGGSLDRKNRSGICGRRNPACRKARREKPRDTSPEPYRITIKTGDTFGRWTALEDYTLDNREILVRCECGTEQRIHGEALVNGHSRGCRSCGQKFRARPPHPPYLVTGEVFDRITVLEDVAYSYDLARCRCECGTEFTPWAMSVKHGFSRSCGCLLRESRTKHGLGSHPLYSTWNGIIARCTNPDSQSYSNYGGRGINVCERWLDVAVFIADIESEIGPRPGGVSKSGRALYSLDRIDNDGNYEPGNVRWGTGSEQVLNQRKVPWLTLKLAAVTRERDALAAELAALKASQGG